MRCLLFILLISAQQSKADDSLGFRGRFWLSGGLASAISTNKATLLGLQAASTFSWKDKHFINARYTVLSDLEFFPGGRELQNRLAHQENISLMYGRIKHLKTWLILLPSLGISAGKATYRGRFLGQGSNFQLSDNYDYQDYKYLGIPANLSLMLTHPAFGLSFDIYANFHRNPDFGFSVNFHVGFIKRKKHTPPGN